MFEETIIRLKDVRISNRGQTENKLDLLNFDEVVLDFRQKLAFLRDFKNGCGDVCRMEVQRKFGQPDQVIIFYPSWADQKGE